MTKDEFMYDHDKVMVEDLIHRLLGSSGGSGQMVQTEVSAKNFFV